jgi:hypothetical protein
MFSDIAFQYDVISGLERGYCIITSAGGNISMEGDSRNSISINCQFYKRSRCQHRLESKTQALQCPPDMMHSYSLIHRLPINYPLTKRGRGTWWLEIVDFAILLFT